MTHKNTLITKTLAKQFARIGDQRDAEDPMVVAKFFGGSSATWYAISYDPESRTCFGFVTGLGYPELGYFSITELESLKMPPFGLPVERDRWFTPCRLSEVKAKTP